MKNEIWSERIPVHPDAASRDDIVILTSELMEARHKLVSINDAVNKLLNFSIGYFPVMADPNKEGYEKGDEKAPFFSETYLYNLMGKGEARTVLSFIRRLCDVVGIAEGDNIMPERYFQKRTEEYKRQKVYNECIWEKDNDWYNDNSYDTSCGQKFSLTNDAGLVENGFIYCSFCGKRIKSKEVK